ncbi:unnamed protein product [Parnassius apollo]|uniref:(apollo) hypothetical protein n=1 Tax=Parnassius apollo TaxID=110799 RepID=A0A8S3WNH5_PARAO|nr:unnamed protein product [Parnassius apollo]
MENKQPPSKKKLLHTTEEKFVRKIDYDSLKQISNLEITQNRSIDLKPSQKVLVSIKPRSHGIKTLYIAEKDRFNTNKIKLLADTNDYNFVDSANCDENESDVLTDQYSNNPEFSTNQNKRSHSGIVSKCLDSTTLCQEYNPNNRKIDCSEKCYTYAQPHQIMNLPKVNELKENKNKTKKVDKETLTATNSSSEDILISTRIVKKLQKRINYLERKILRQEMVFRSMDPNSTTSSSDEEMKENIVRSISITGPPGCSYIEQYSHIPETSAFQRYTQQSTSASVNKATNIAKSHNSEQYGRDFTAYDGITARGRRQSSSVPGKRDDIPKMAAERVHKIRHKLNPVRDYRLMDTVHYLAQGEFAPRDDGIKLTPSREAVLSDIIWEDVCRTHWPNARLGRRQHSDRYNSRFELQRLIDNLLRERVAHVERRRRRHYRIVKLNHRHENCRPVGKTGDIIVASHKSKQSNEDRDIPTINKKIASAILTNNNDEEHNPRRNPKSHDRLTYPWSRKKRHKQDDCSPGPSSAVYHSATRKDSACCNQVTNPSNTTKYKETKHENVKEQISGNNISNSKVNTKTPRLLVKKDSLRRKHSAKNKPNLERYILLPTLVVRTPSNVKRQKKFNELYHRVLNVQFNNERNDAMTPESTQKCLNPSKKDIGININVILSSSEESFNRN